MISNWKENVLTVFRRIFARREFQEILEIFMVLTRAGMNVGSGTLEHSRSGEVFVMRKIASLFSGEQVTVFDVGAHRGDYAQHLLKEFGDKMELYCFEPSTSIFEQLSDNIRPESANLLSIAFGENSGNRPLYETDGNIPTLFKSHFDMTGETITHIEQVEIRSLASFCEQHKIGRIHFLKVDVEGHELGVLKGATHYIAEAKVDFIQFEFGQHSLSARVFIKDFFDLLGDNYKIFRILPNGLHDIGSYRPELEIFASATNYLGIAARHLENDDI